MTEKEFIEKSKKGACGLLQELISCDKGLPLYSVNKFNPKVIYYNNVLFKLCLITFTDFPEYIFSASPGTMKDTMDKVFVTVYKAYDLNALHITKSC